MQQIENILNEIREIKSILEAQKDFQSVVLTFEDAKKFLGVSAGHLYKLTSTNQIPHYKPRGKMLYFEKSEIEAWLLQNRVSTGSELTEKADCYVSSKLRG